MPIIVIEGAAAIGPGVDVQLKRAVGVLLRALHQRLARQDGACAHEHRQCRHRRRQADLVVAPVGGRSAADARAGPIIIPAASGQAHVIGRRAFGLGRPRDQQPSGEREGHRRIARCRHHLGIVIKDRSHQRVARACGRLRRRVEIGHQPIAFLDEATPDRQMFGAIDPWFGARRILGGMVAKDRRKGGILEPAGHQLG